MRFILFCALTFGFSQQTLSEDSLTDETEQIRETISNYFNGVRLSDERLLETAFDVNSGHMKGFLIEENKEATVTSKPIKEVIQTWIAKGKRPEMNGRILSIEIFGSAATVTFDFDNKYLDFFHLVRTKSGWKIINKFYIYK